MTNKDRYIKDLNSLIHRGVELQRGLYNELRIKDSPLNLEDIQKRRYQHYRFIEQALRPLSTSLL